MNWEAIGAVAETLGAVGVIASLVYLATQIRQSRDQMERNTRAMQAGSYQEFIQGLHTTIMDAMKVPALEPAVRVGMLDFEQLSEADAFRFNFWVRGILVSWENAH